MLYSWRAFEIHKIDKSKYENNKWFMYNQYWFNGLGAFIGWCALYVLLFNVIGIGSCEPSLGNIISGDGTHTLANLGLITFAFMGITGYLPFVSLIDKRLV